MDSFHRKCILDISNIAERCVAGYDTLYRRTKLSIGNNTRFSDKGMGDHSSDADDEITDISGEDLSCSPEFCASSKQYYILSGTKPFSLVIRRCSTPTTESNSPCLKKDFSVSSPLAREPETTSKKEVLNSDRKENDSFLHQRASVSCNIINSNVEESDDMFGETVSGRTVSSLEEVILNTSKEGNDWIVTQECIENIVYGNGQHVDVCTIHNAENGVYCNYTDCSALLPTKPVFGSGCNDSTDGNCSLHLQCSQERCRRGNNESMDNRNQYSSDRLGNPNNAQSLIHMLLTEQCKQVELSTDNSVLDVRGEDSNVGITKSGECQEIKAVNIIKDKVKSPADAVLDIDSFHLTERSECAEKMVDLDIQPEFAIGGKCNLESSIVKSSLNKVHEGGGLVTVDDSLKLENSELALLEGHGGNAKELETQTEKCNEDRGIVNHDVDMTVDRNLFCEADHILCVGKQDEQKKTEVTSDVSKTAVWNDTGKSVIEIEIGCESLFKQESDYTSQESKINMLQNSAVVNTIRNASESISVTSDGCQKFEAGNSKNSSPVIHTANRQTLPVEHDNFVQTHVECFYDDDHHDGGCGGGSGATTADDDDGLKIESIFCHTLSSKNFVLPLYTDGALIADEMAKDMPVNDKAEVIKDSLGNSVLAGELEENITVGGEDCDRVKFCAASNADHLQSQSSFLVELHTEHALGSDVHSDTGNTELSPLLFSSDDDNSFYTETINCEQEVAAATSNYDKTVITEQKKLHRLQEALLGVPPPPSVTIPRHDVADILRLWKENKSLMISTNAKSEADAGTVKPQTAVLKQSYLEQMKKISWPESKYYSCYGIQYNRGQISEEFEMLCQRLRERYVGSETTSSCNIWFNCDISNKVHNVNSRHRSTGHSPGSRLSHLARRRRTFSSASLLNSSVVGQLPGNRHSAAVERRLIMVDLKKTEHRQRSRSHQPHKQVPFVDRNRLQQTKRALFKSPSINHKRIFYDGKSRSGSKKAKTDIDRSRIENSKRSLWPCTSKSNVTVNTGHNRVQTSLSGETSVFRKRKREEHGMLTPHNICARRMLFCDAAAVKGKSDCMTAGDNIQRLRTGENKPQVLSVSRDVTGGLSEVHRKKLLWAVAEALRAEGITMSHPLFRSCATSLARLVRNVMPDLNCKRAFSTSDLMLQLAKQYIGDVMKEQQNGLTIINSRT